jgi:hypothetical protein
VNILLVYPEFPDTFWSFKHALRFVRKKAGTPPLGLLTVAAMLPATWEKRLVDLNVTGLSQERPTVGRLRLHQRDDRTAGCSARRHRAL